MERHWFFVALWLCPVAFAQSPLVVTVSIRTCSASSSKASSLATIVPTYSSLPYSASGLPTLVSSMQPPPATSTPPTAASSSNAQSSPSSQTQEPIPMPSYDSGDNLTSSEGNLYLYERDTALLGTTIEIAGSGVRKRQNADQYRPLLDCLEQCDGVEACVAVTLLGESCLLYANVESSTYVMDADAAFNVERFTGEEPAPIPLSSTSSLASPVNEKPSQSTPPPYSTPYLTRTPLSSSAASSASSRPSSTAVSLSEVYSTPAISTDHATMYTPPPSPTSVGSTVLPVTLSIPSSAIPSSSRIPSSSSQSTVSSPSPLLSNSASTQGVSSRSESPLVSVTSSVGRASSSPSSTIQLSTSGPDTASEIPPEYSSIRENLSTAVLEDTSSSTLPEETSEAFVASSYAEFSISSTGPRRYSTTSSSPTWTSSSWTLSSSSLPRSSSSVMLTTSRTSSSTIVPTSSSSLVRSTSSTFSRSSSRPVVNYVSTSSSAISKPPLYPGMSTSSTRTSSSSSSSSSPLSSSSSSSSPLLRPTTSWSSSSLMPSLSSSSRSSSRTSSTSLRAAPSSSSRSSSQTPSTSLRLSLSSSSRSTCRTSTTSSSSSSSRTPSSSRPAVPSPTPVRNSGKRGLCYTNDTLTYGYSLSGQNSQVSWGYNYFYQSNTSPGSPGINPALDFVPLLFNDDPGLTDVWPQYAQKAIDEGADSLLAFNEPDLCYPGSSCMTVNQSVVAWRRFMEPFAGKVRLGAPAVTNGGPPSSLQWLGEFMGNCTDCTIDFVPIHWYSSIYAFSYLQYYVQLAYNVTGKPIWVTEFGIDSNGGSEEQYQAFLKMALPWLDAVPYVERYAWFYDGPGFLIEADGSGLSAQGMIYNSYTAPCPNWQNTDGHC